MGNRLGLGAGTTMGLDPVGHVRLAAALDCRTVSIRLAQDSAENPHGHAAWDLREDPALRRALRETLAECGVAPGFGTGLDCAADRETWALELDLFAELGSPRVVASDHRVEHARAVAALAEMSDLAQERGMEFSIGFSPLCTIATLPIALDAVQEIGADRASIAIDTMHFFRSGGTVKQVAELDPAWIGCVQFADAPRKGEGEYLHESRNGRMIPGQGALPLREFADALPRGLALMLEVPLPAAARSGRAPEKYVAELVERTRTLLA